MFLRLYLHVTFVTPWDLLLSQYNYVDVFIIYR